MLWRIRGTATVPAVVGRRRGGCPLGMAVHPPLGAPAPAAKRLPLRGRSGFPRQRRVPRGAPTRPTPPRRPPPTAAAPRPRRQLPEPLERGAEVVLGRRPGERRPLAAVRAQHRERVAEVVLHHGPGERRPLAAVLAQRRLVRRHRFAQGRRVPRFGRRSRTGHSRMPSGRRLAARAAPRPARAARTATGGRPPA